MKKPKQVRLSMKLLWKLFSKEYQKYLTDITYENDTAYNFLTFLEEHARYTKGVSPNSKNNKNHL